MKDEYDKTALETVIGNAVVGYLWPDEADDGLQPSPQGVRAAVKQALRSRLAEPDEMDGYQSCGPDGPEGHDEIPSPSPQIGADAPDMVKDLLETLERGTKCDEIRLTRGLCKEYLVALRAHEVPKDENTKERES